MGEVNNNDKVFTACVVESVRDVVDVIHEKHISKDDLVTIIRDNGVYIIFYYK